MNAFVELLYQKMYDKMYSVASRLAGNDETAKELVQDVFVLALSRREQLFDHPNPEGWLMKVLVNLIKNERRRHSRFDIPLDELFETPSTGQTSSLEEMLPVKLSKADKQVLIWRYEERMEYREMADRLGITEAGCRSRISRANERCRKLMKEENDSL